MSDSKDWGDAEYTVTYPAYGDWDDRNFGTDWIAAQDFYEAKVAQHGTDNVTLTQGRRHIAAPLGRYRKNEGGE